MKSWIMDNWQMLLALVLMVAGLVIYLCRAPREKVLQWLLWAVTKAESELGSGTGQLKLAMVYDMFIVRFPKISKILSFKAFSKLVDIALARMRCILEQNRNISLLVEKRTTL